MTGASLKLLVAWWRSNDGISAVEFALVAPILFFSLLATADLGLALHQRMGIDHVLRAGAQSAMTDPGRHSVAELINSIAADSYTVSERCDDTVAETLDLCVDRYFACAEAPDVKIQPSTFCAGNRAPNIYYQLTGRMRYEGIFLPIEIGPLALGQPTLSSAAQVQVR